MRWLFRLLFLPLWLPWRLLGWLGHRASSRSTLRLALSGALPDLPPSPHFLSWLRRSEGPHLIGVLRALEHARRDPKLSTVVVRIDHLACGLGRAEELRAALSRVHAAGKTVIVHADELGLAGYWLALGASSIRLVPSGSLDVCGIAMEFTLLKGLLDRAGVRAQLGARGAYKSMREMFSESAISSENREMLESLVGDLSAQLVSLVAEARKRTPEAARADLDAGPFRAEEARERGLVDQLQYRDELYEELGGKEKPAYGLRAYLRRQRWRHFWPRRPARVALVRVSGHIRSGDDRPGRSGPRASGDRSLRRALEAVSKQRQVRAILLRVDSPGGSALASDVMWRELSRAAKKKPLFVSMVNVAASGGYYVSGISSGVPIFANPNTLTGSIGVVGGKFELSGLLAALGVHRETIASGPRADYHSIATPWGPDELVKLERDIEASYRDFVSKMAEARGLSYEALHRVAQGRVWTGRQARDGSLVDHLGGFYEAERALRERAAIPEDVEIHWVAASAPSRLGSKHEGALGALLGVADESLELPELAESLARALDLSPARLLYLSPIQLRNTR